VFRDGSGFQVGKHRGEVGNTTRYDPEERVERVFGHGRREDARLVFRGNLGLDVFDKPAHGAGVSAAV